MELSTLTEQKIIDAAEKVFYLKGKAGASMQDIAQEAGITRTSLNYYFRSKDKLFESVFRAALGKFVPGIIEITRKDIPFGEFVKLLVEKIIDSLIDNPQVPIFVLAELSSNPSRMPQVLLEMGIEFDFLKKFKQDSYLHRLNIDPRQLIINVISLCIFPFAARSIVQTIFYGGDKKEYIEAMKERKKMVPEIIEAYLKNSVN